MMSRNQFACLIIFSMLYVSLPICAEVLLHKPVLIAHATAASASTLVIPLWFILSGVITELYHYKIAKSMFYCTFIGTFIFSCLMTIIIPLPSPLSWQGEAGYEFVLGDALKQFLESFAGLLIGGFINIYLINKWKTLLQGRYFLLRSIGAATAGEIITTLITFCFIFYQTPAQQNITTFIFLAIILKIISSFLFAFPTSILVLLLKKTDYIHIQYRDYLHA